MTKENRIIGTVDVLVYADGTAKVSYRAEQATGNMSGHYGSGSEDLEQEIQRALQNVMRYRRESK